MAYMTVTNTLVNGNTADAGELNTNFTDIINGTSDGSKDLNIAALTCAGNVTFNANTTIGNATSDTVTFTARAASDFLPSADDTYDLGSSSLKWADIRGVLGTFTGLLTAESGIKPSSGSDALTYYEEDTAYSAAVTGFSDISSVTIRYVRIGKLVTIHVPIISGTSNTNTFRITIPASLRVSSGISGLTLLPRFVDNGTTYTVETQAGVVWQGSSYLDFRTTTGGGTWTATPSTKGLAREITVSYVLD
jgi:hypothetical protein